MVIPFIRFCAGSRDTEGNVDVDGTWDPLEIPREELVTGGGFWSADDVVMMSKMTAGVNHGNTMKVSRES